MMILSMFVFFACGMLDMFADILKHGIWGALRARGDSTPSGFNSFVYGIGIYFVLPLCVLAIALDLYFHYLAWREKDVPLTSSDAGVSEQSSGEVGWSDRIVVPTQLSSFWKTQVASSDSGTVACWFLGGAALALIGYFGWAAFLKILLWFVAALPALAVLFFQHQRSRLIDRRAVGQRDESWSDDDEDEYSQLIKQFDWPAYCAAALGAAVLFVGAAIFGGWFFGPALITNLGAAIIFLGKRSSEPRWREGGWAAVILSSVLAFQFLGLAPLPLVAPLNADGSQASKPTVETPAVATKNYWEALRQIGDSINESSNTAPQTIAEFRRRCVKARTDCRNAAQRIIRLPVQHVDQDAIEIGSRFYETLSRKADIFDEFVVCVDKATSLEQHAESGEAMLESMIRGYFGDPFGKSKEIRRKGSALEREYWAIDARLRSHNQNTSKIISDANRIRAVLSRRYSEEFGVIE